MPSFAFSPASDEEFLRRLVEELPRARAKFPGPNPTVAALTEEVGEVAQAILHLREGKHTSSSEAVIAEAVQVALMAMRLATEGDETLTTTLPTALGGPLVVLTDAEAARLQDDSTRLDALRAHGVDNWQGYADAMRTYWGEDEAED